MPTLLNPYINFLDNAKEAMEFYRSVFGGELTSTTFQEGGMPVDDTDQQLIMHSQLTTAKGFTLMGSDTPQHMRQDGAGRGGFTVSLSGDDEAELTGYWEKLADGATVTAPLEKAPWGDTFGMCTDKYGVDWMVNISPSAA